MSELEKTAPNEIYLIVGDTDKDCNFNELAEVTWADKPIYEETAIKYIKSYQLTIPKSIADLADKEFNQLNDDVLGFGYSATEFGYDSSELRLWVTNDDTWDIESGKRANILSAYLAGKALGVDLVKVVEG